MSAAPERSEALAPLLADAREAATALRDSVGGAEPANAFGARWSPIGDQAGSPGDVTSEHLRAGELSPREAVATALERIAAVDPAVEAFVAVRGEAALEEADKLTEELAQSGPRGPLHGMPIAVKDLFDVAGLPTRCGSAVRAAAAAATDDATAVQRLRAAGAIVIGKTTTHEFAYGPICPPTRNAWNQEHISGGSSGGSAVAVALGMAGAAVGTDTGGSVRCPAAYNGVVGLKPTYGRVSKAGVVPLSWSLDHVGPMARSVADVAAMLEALSGWDPEDPTSAREPVPPFADVAEGEAAGMRVGVATHYFQDTIQLDVLEAFDAAVEHLCSIGAQRIDVRIDAIELAPRAQLGILLPEASAYHQHDVAAAPDRYGADVLPFLDLGEALSATHYVNALRARSLVRDGFRRCFEEHRLDVLLTPTLPLTAPRIGQSSVRFGDGEERSAMEPLLVACAPANLTGQPVLTVPCGFDADRLPIGLSVVGRPFDEATVLGIGAAYEATAGWRDQSPPDPVHAADPRDRTEDTEC